MEAVVKIWDPERGVGLLHFPDVGSKGDLIVSTALFVESGYGEPFVGEKFTCELRVPPGGGKLEPHNFLRI